VSAYADFVLRAQRFRPFSGDNWGCRLPPA
jgi:hypothetical protein